MYRRCRQGAWLDTNSLIVENYLRDRYDAEAEAEAHTSNGEDVRAECGVLVQADSITGPQTARQAPDGSKRVREGRGQRTHRPARVPPPFASGGRR